MAYKYSKTIQNGAETLIDGIENIEMFLDDDDDWNFHDSEIHSFHWNRNTLTFTVTVMPMGYSAVIDGFYDGDAILLDFHFEDCIEVHMPNADLYSSPYIYEIEISKSHNFLECWFNGYSMRITSYRLRVDKPRLAEE